MKKTGIFTKNITKNQIKQICKRNKIKTTIQTSPENIYKKTENIKKTTAIHLYDITYNTKQPNNKETQINNHINKTGENPLIKQKEKNIFVDITHPYAAKKGKTTTSLGKRYDKEKHKHPTPSTNICHYNIVLQARGFKKIYGILINTLR